VGPQALDASVAGRPTGFSQAPGQCLDRDDPCRAEKNDITPWAVATWCIPPQADADFVCHMEDVLATYQLPYNPAVPVICIDEASKQLIGEVATPLPTRPAQPICLDYEYERLGASSSSASYWRVGVT
jgi:hypothetical protein